MPLLRLFWHASEMACGRIGSRLWWTLALVLSGQFLWCSQKPASAAAQEQAEESKTTPQYTLHAYANLIQVPVLALTPMRDHLRTALQPDRFFIRIDSGPWFRATHVRVEGDDPISLAIVLDLRGEGTRLVAHMDDDLSALAPGLLHPSDHVTLYALDCGAERSLNNRPASPELLKRGVTAVLQAWRDRTASHSRCGKSPTLHDTLFYALSELEKLPGRRVIILVSASADSESEAQWRELAETAQMGGTAMFAISPATVSVIQMRGTRLSVSQTSAVLDTMCQLSGGLLISDNPNMKNTLADIVRMLRERYIVEFPRPFNSTAGRHTLEVRVDKTAAFIRPAGLSVPIPDPATLADPTTVPTDPNLAPVQGKRSVLPK